MVKEALQKLNEWRLRWAYGLLLLPNINPLKFLFGAEVFPWATLVSTSKRTAPSLFYLLFLAFITASSLYTLSTGVGLMTVGRSAMAFFNATLVFFYVVNLDKQQKAWFNRSVMTVLVVNTVVSLAQLFEIIPIQVEQVVKIFIERFEAKSYSEFGGRGSAGLYAEPSYAGMAMQYMMAYLFFMRRIEFHSVLGRILLLGVFLFQLLVVRSATSLVVFAIFFFATQDPRKLMRVFLFFIFVLILLSTLAVYIPNPPRALDVFSIFFKSFLLQDSGHMPYNVLMNESGFRIIGTWGTYWYGIIHPLGCGVGNWGNGSIEAMELLGYPASELDYFITYYGGDFEGVRPTAFLAGIFLEMGILGFLFWLLTFSRFLFSKPLWLEPRLKPIAVLFIGNMLVVGTIGDPVPYVFLAMAYDQAQKVKIT